MATTKETTIAKETAAKKAPVKPLSIQIFYHGDTPEIEELSQGDWIDLSAAQSMSLRDGEYALIPLGVSMQLPKGYEAHIVPRSSTFKHWGIIQTNGMGIIDESYCGEDDQWFMPVLATRDTTIFCGDRVCQFRIMPKMTNYELNTVKHLKNKARGGFGSTGKN